MPVLVRPAAIYLIFLAQRFSMRSHRIMVWYSCITQGVAYQQHPFINGSAINDQPAPDLFFQLTCVDYVGRMARQDM